MRPVHVLFAIIVAASSAGVACGSSEMGATAPVAIAELEPAAALEEAAARSAAVMFLQAYANAPERGVERLRLLAALRELRRWAHWLGVQNHEFPGDQLGVLELTSVGRSVRVPIEGRTGDLVRDVQVAATATFRLVPESGAPFENERVLDGPVRVVHAAPGSWLVVNVFRDGIPLTQVFEVVSPPVTAGVGRLTVTLDSFLSVPGWQFDLVVELERGRAALAARDAMLVDAGGDIVARANVVTASIADLHASGDVEGLVTFDPLGSAQGLMLRLRFQSDGKPLVVNLPLEDRIHPVPIAASPSVAP